MPSCHRGPLRASHFEHKRLARFSCRAYQYGAFFNNYRWQVYGCLTFKKSITRESAHQMLRVYMGRLRRRLGRIPLGWIAVLEHRVSGLGSSGAHFHWHFVAASSRLGLDRFCEVAEAVWSSYGQAKIEPYDAGLPGVHYMAKTANSSNFDWEFDGLKHLEPRSELDLFQAQQDDPYVPAHAKPYTSLDTLVIRPRHGTVALASSEWAKPATSKPQLPRKEVRDARRQ